MATDIPSGVYSQASELSFCTQFGCQARSLLNANATLQAEIVRLRIILNTHNIPFKEKQDEDSDKSSSGMEETTSKG